MQKASTPSTCMGPHNKGGGWQDAQCLPYSKNKICASQGREHEAYWRHVAHSYRSTAPPGNSPAGKCSVGCQGVVVVACGRQQYVHGVHLHVHIGPVGNKGVGMCGSISHCGIQPRIVQIIVLPNGTGRMMQYAEFTQRPAVMEWMQRVLFCLYNSGNLQNCEEH